MAGKKNGNGSEAVDSMESMIEQTGVMVTLPASDFSTKLVGFSGHREGLKKGNLFAETIDGAPYDSGRTGRKEADYFLKAYAISKDGQQSPCNAIETDDGKYELIGGHNRAGGVWHMYRGVENAKITVGGKGGEIEFSLPANPDAALTLNIVKLTGSKHTAKLIDNTQQTAITGADKVRNICKLAAGGMNQTEIARLVGTNQGNVSKYLTAAKQIGSAFLALCENSVKGDHIERLGKAVATGSKEAIKFIAESVKVGNKIVGKDVIAVIGEPEKATPKTWVDKATLRSLAADKGFLSSAKTKAFGKLLVEFLESADADTGAGTVAEYCESAKERKDRLKMIADAKAAAEENDAKK
jgi:hypothetical protein